MPLLTLHRIEATAKLLLLPIAGLAFAASAGAVAVPALALGVLAYGLVVLGSAAFPTRAVTERGVAAAFILGVGWALGVRQDDEFIRLMAIGCGGCAGTLPLLLRDFQLLARRGRHMGLAELRVVAAREARPRRAPARARQIIALLPDLRARDHAPDELVPGAPESATDLLRGQ